MLAGKGLAAMRDALILGMYQSYCLLDHDHVRHADVLRHLQYLMYMQMLRDQHDASGAAVVYAELQPAAVRLAQEGLHIAQPPGEVMC